MGLSKEVARRRTFAIISHPDAGKTTLTEKLLLYGGVLHMAGAVKARKASSHAVSDWMEMEKEKGISITSSVLQFDYRGKRMNLLDTPGHADFSEDTYRTLAAVDSAVMLLDVAKGVEARTLKLFEVCRLRKLPVITFVNKMDRSGLDPLELLDAVGRTLNIRTVPLNWPIGSGPDFEGVVDLLTREVTLYERVAAGTTVLEQTVTPLGDPGLRDRLGGARYDDLLETLELLDIAGDSWCVEDFLAGDVTPFFFGSAMTNFGVEPLLEALLELAPAPQPRVATTSVRAPDDPAFSGFVFKIQANMNPRHRDRIAFLRVVSGSFERGMAITVARSGKVLRSTNPHSFVASERSIVEWASPGDIVGIYDPGSLRLGDTLYADTPITYAGIPRFAPEHFVRVRLADPSRRKHFTKGISQLAHEGAIQRFVDPDLGEADPYLGAVGLLQLEVLTVRLRNEYNTEVHLQPTDYCAARWIGGDPAGLAWLQARRGFKLVRDRDGRPVVLVSGMWALQHAMQQVPGLEFYEVSPLHEAEPGL